ncbi:DUF222 domain-containing protein [Acidipropionibacterium timonense]|uniref:DUF222 domain-containing protein n=1 Tax=Acidipropionibacterium timonense TaxID=2161818 RepID=UPI001AEBB15B|nr:DUF222 domain-containing protein [Acidipropionibacterium timonense]
MTNNHSNKSSRSDAAVSVRRGIADAIAATVVAERRAVAQRMALVAELVDVYECPAVEIAPGSVRGTRVADGVPLVDEFLVPELAAVLGVGVPTAWHLVRDVTCLVHRHPRTWAALQQGRVDAWQARRVAQACREAELSADQCRIVDDRLADTWGRLPWARIRRRLAGLVLAVDEERAARRRQVRWGRRFLAMRHGDDGMTTLVGRLASADALALQHRLDQIRAAIVDADPGVDASADQLAADALGILARGRWAGDAGPRGRATMVVHLDRADLRRAIDGGPTGTAVVEGTGTDLGPVLLAEVRALLGDNAIHVQPVIDLTEDPAIDGYVPHARIRRRVLWREPVSVFPYSSTRSRRCDLDHTVPWRRLGPPGQTRPSNLGPLARLEHRVKTFGGWRVRQPSPGRYEWTSPLGFRYVVAQGRTTREVHAPDGSRVDDREVWAHGRLATMVKVHGTLSRHCGPNSKDPPTSCMSGENLQGRVRPSSNRSRRSPAPSSEPMISDNA